MYFPVLHGAMCRILLYSSLAYSTTNKITVELSTPRPLNTSLPTNVDGISFCYNGHSSLGSAANIHISSLEEGGNISQQIEQKLINTSSSWNTSSFFQSSARWQINPIESGTVFDILGSDPYYSSSYTRTRYACPELHGLLGDILAGHLLHGCPLTTGSCGMIMLCTSLQI